MRNVQSVVYRHARLQSIFGELQSATVVISVLLALTCLLPIYAGASSLKLLSPSTGWVAHESTLYWTTDGGNNWADITPIPPGVARAGLSTHVPFFRNTSEGWAVVSYDEPPSSGSIAALSNKKKIYTTAHTRDGGASWSFSLLAYPELPEWIQGTFAGPRDLFFLDSLHGWLDIAFAGNSQPGKLLATDDGGKTWTWVNGPTFSGPVTFASLQDGWILGYFGGEKLFVTHDGSKTWQEVSIPAPSRVGAAKTATFQGPPIFQDSRRGFLVAHYYGEPGVPTKLVVFSTIDSGHTWQVAKVLEESRAASASFPFAIPDSTIVVPTESSTGSVLVSPVSLQNSVSARIAVSNRGIRALTFANVTAGWAMLGDRLFATSDGGSMWKEISPWHASSSAPVPKLPVSEGPKQKTLQGVTDSSGLQPSLLEAAPPSRHSFGIICEPHHPWRFSRRSRC